MGKIAAIDYGLKRIGIAISDANKIMALPLATVEGGKKAIENILRALDKKEVERIVMGLPLLLSGQKGEMAQEVEAFAKRLEEKSGIPVSLLDERLSSGHADVSLKELSLSRKKRTETVDQVTAMHLLQVYLDREYR